MRRMLDRLLGGRSSRIGLRDRFLEGVKRIPEEKTLVLMLDTYEVTGVFFG